ncbi:glycosyltransferase 87 family protein [Robertkochia flava]|uniref:glycosyltransferase 87 family protein n=1 Tax=Robertkochia flava TaxID=3447986 RepID=UPI001CCF8327|nr:glycosyltransferase 87 family protein [Robertkochia marina]
MKRFFQANHLLLYAAAIISLVLYSFFGYHLERSEFLNLCSIYFALFALFLFSWNIGRDYFKGMMLAGILFRILLLFSLPNLSQDFYRFIWDGELMLSGINPYLHTPTELIETQKHNIPFANRLYEGMGMLSASHYSNYPPVNQFFFLVAALLGGTTLMGKVAVLKLVMLLGDLGVVYFGKKLLRLLKKPKSLILLYFLNPFIILEINGNLHFEGVMMCFFLWGLWLLFSQRYTGAAVMTGLSISVKLIPLIFLPLLMMYLTRGSFLPARKEFLRSLSFGVVSLAVFGLSFSPFFSSENLSHFTASVGLWFSTFEFNASLYYLVREVGYWNKGYNIIGSIAPWIPLLTLISVLILCFRRENKTPQGLITAMTWAITIYLFISTTVHPWYLTTPLVLSLLIDKRYVLVWTALVILSYFAYSLDPYKESAVLLIIQYGLVYFMFIREMILKRKIKAFSG